MEENKVATGTESSTATAAPPPASPPVIVSSTVPPPPETAAPAAAPAPAPEAAASAAPPPPAAPAPTPAPAPAPAATDKPAAAPSLLPGVSAPPPGFDYVGFFKGLPLSGQTLAAGGLLGAIGVLVGAIQYSLWSSPEIYLMMVVYLVGPAGVWLLYQKTPHANQKFLTWAVGQAAAFVGGGAILAIVGSVLHLSVLLNAKAIMTIIGGAAMAFGSFLKAKEEKLF